MKAAEIMVKCLENEGVECIFGLPGEENIDVMDALRDSTIRFVLARHEQGASFMADIYGRLTGKAGVCLATLGPGAINLTLGTADATLDSAPLVAIAGQASVGRLFKESHQNVDLVELFRPITKWASRIVLPETTPEIVRKAFKLAQTERPGATLVVFPEDVARHQVQGAPLRPAQPKPTAPNPAQLGRALALLSDAKNPMILAGYGVYRNNASEALARFTAKTNIPVATTFMAKGVIDDDNPLSQGAIGFMRHDYVNFGFDKADVIIAVGYDLIEYAPHNVNPGKDKNIIHIHVNPAEVDAAYDVQIGLLGDISASLDALGNALVEVHGRLTCDTDSCRIHELLGQELREHENDASFPVKPQRLVADTRKAMGRDDIVLCDTGALKMWMSRLYPCHTPGTFIVSNGLGTMGFAVPGAIAAKLARPERKVLAVTGDGGFLMNSQELETARRENLAFTVLIWRDDHYGLIKWKQELEFGRDSFVKFSNPDLVQYANSFGIRAYSVGAAEELLPTLREALDSGELCVVECPVDYSENTRLTDKLGGLMDTM